MLQQRFHENLSKVVVMLLTHKARQTKHFHTDWKVYNVVVLWYLLLSVLCTQVICNTLRNLTSRKR